MLRRCCRMYIFFGVNILSLKIFPNRMFGKKIIRFVASGNNCLRKNLISFSIYFRFNFTWKFSRFRTDPLVGVSPTSDGKFRFFQVPNYLVRVRPYGFGSVRGDPGQKTHTRKNVRKPTCTSVSLRRWP